MSKSKEMFIDMKEKELALIYRADFSKKDCQKKGVELSEKILEDGLITKEDAFVNLTRLCEVLNTAKENLKESFPKEKLTHLGVEITPINGRKIYNFSENAEWLEKSNELKKIEERLKISANGKNLIFCSETGEEIQKVSFTYAKDSLTVKF
jgi:hypothetical protein